MKKWLKTMAWAAAAGAVLATVAVSAAGYAVQRATDGRVYASPGEVPANRAGLLLGTSRTVRSGRPNAYFYNRVDAAAALYHAGKVEYLVISGDNGRKGYNEPQDMKEALVGRGVPAEAIPRLCRVPDVRFGRSHGKGIRAGELHGNLTGVP